MSRVIVKMVKLNEVCDKNGRERVSRKVAD